MPQLERVPAVIELVEPDPTWPRQFEEIGRTLRSAFGARALRIDHIGSTAVPGLLAKDVIDIQVTVQAFDGVADVLATCGVALLGDIAFDHRPAGAVLPDEELVKQFGQTSTPRAANLHVRLRGRTRRAHTAR
jgi:dephospho-CoA kinase